MNDLMLERRWDVPMSEADMHAMATMAQECLGIHRVNWCESLLSADGMEQICHFSGPDAESVRIAVYEPGKTRGTIWPCSIHDAPGIAEGDLAQANVVVEHRFYDPADIGAKQADDVNAGCFVIHRVRRVRSFVSTDRRRMICLYQAPDAESVRLAHRDAGMPADRIFAVRRYAP